MKKNQICRQELCSFRLRTKVWKRAQLTLITCLFMALISGYNAFGQTTLGQASDFALLSGGSYVGGVPLNANGKVGAVNTNINNVTATTLYAAADTNTTAALADVQAFRASIMSNPTVTYHMPNVNGDTLVLTNGIHEIPAGTYRNLIILAQPDSGMTATLRCFGKLVLDSADIAIGLGLSPTCFSLVTDSTLRLNQTSIYGNLVADSIVVEGNIMGRGALLATDKLDVSQATISDNTEFNSVFLPTAVAATQAPLPMEIGNCPTTDPTPNNLIRNGNFTDFRFFDGGRLRQNTAVSVTANSPACNWELVHPTITPDLYYTRTIATQANTCDYPCDYTTIPQNRFGANGATNNILGNSTGPEGAIGLEISKTLRESYTQKTKVALSTGNYYAAFRTRGFKWVTNCIPCAFSPGNTGYYTSVCQGLGLAVTPFKPNFSTPAITPTTPSGPNGHYNDRNGREIVTQVELTRPVTDLLNISDQWRLVSGQINLTNATNATTYLTIGNFLHNDDARLSVNNDYFLVDNIELFHMPEPVSRAVCVQNNTVNLPAQITGAALPASAEAVYSWTVTAGAGVTFADPTALTTTYSFAPSGPTTATVTLSVTTKSYNGGMQNGVPIFTTSTYSKSAVITLTPLPTVSPTSISLFAQASETIHLIGSITGAVTWYQKASPTSTSIIVGGQTDTVLIVTQPGIYYATINNIDCLQTTAEVLVTNNAPTALASTTTNLTTIFPNPFTDKLMVTSSAISKVTITNNLGQRFDLRVTEEGDGMAINTKDLPIGMYYLRYEHEGQMVNHKKSSKPNEVPSCSSVRLYGGHYCCLRAADYLG